MTYPNSSGVHNCFVFGYLFNFVFNHYLQFLISYNHNEFTWTCIYKLIINCMVNIIYVLVNLAPTSSKARSYMILSNNVRTFRSCTSQIRQVMTFVDHKCKTICFCRSQTSWISLTTANAPLHPPLFGICIYGIFALYKTTAGHNTIWN